MNTRRVCQGRASKSWSTASSCARASSGRIASTAETIRSTRAEAAPFAPQPIWNGRTTTRDGSACRRSAWLNNSSKGGAPAAGFGTYGGANERYATARSGFATGPASFERAEIAHEASRSEEHPSELQSLMRISYAVFFLQKKNT